MRRGLEGLPGVRSVERSGFVRDTCTFRLRFDEPRALSPAALSRAVGEFSLDRVAVTATGRIEAEGDRRILVLKSGDRYEVRGDDLPRECADATVVGTLQEEGGRPLLRVERYSRTFLRR